MSLSKRNENARRALNREREWNTIFRHVRLWEEAKTKEKTSPVDKFCNMAVPANSDKVLIVTDIEPYSYSITENNEEEIKYPYMINILTFTSREQLRECIHQTAETFRQQTSRFDVTVEMQVCKQDKSSLRCLMIAYEMPLLGE